MNLIKRSLVSTSVIILALFALGGIIQAQDSQARHGLSPAQFQSTFDDLYKKGYRLKTVGGYMSGGAERFAALWIKESGPAWTALAGMSAADFQKNFDDYSKQGFRLTWVSAHEVNGTVHYEGIWEQKSGPAWEAKQSRASDSFM